MHVLRSPLSVKLKTQFQLRFNTLSSQSKLLSTNFSTKTSKYKEAREVVGNLEKLLLLFTADVVGEAVGSGALG